MRSTTVSSVEIAGFGEIKLSKRDERERKLELRCEINHILNKLGIQKGINKVPSHFWFSISSYKYLSENFIREYRDKLNFRKILMAQKFSPEFIEEMRTWDKLNLPTGEDPVTPREFWERVLKDQTLPEWYIRKLMKEDPPPTASLGNWASHLPLFNEEDE